MTVTTNTNKVQALGNGVAKTFPYFFRIYSASDLVVTSTDLDTGVDTTLVLNTDYTVTGAGSYNGGNVVLTGAAPSATTRITIRRVIPVAQGTDLRNQGAYFAETHEDVFDKLTMIAQQHQETLDRSLTLSPTSTGASTTLPNPSGSKVIGWNEEGTALQNYGPVDNTLLAVQLAASEGVAMVGNAADMRDLVNTTDPAKGVALVGNALDKRDLSSQTDTAKGDALIGIKRDDLTGSVATTLHAWMKGQIANLKTDFGATMDGTADDATALQTAINNLPSGSTLVIPPGTVRVNSSIAWPQGKILTIRGAGFRGTEIRSYAGGVPVFNYARTESQSGAIMCFENLQFVLNGLGKTAGSSAIRSYGYADLQDDNWLRAHNCAFYGFENAVSAKWTGQTKFEDCFFQENTRSFDLGRGASFWEFVSCMSYDATFVRAQDTIADAYSNSLVFDSCDSITATSDNVIVQNYQSVYMRNCGWDLGSGGTAALWFVGVLDAEISGCYISGNGVATRDGIRLDNCVRVTARGNTIVNNTVGMRVTGANGAATRATIDDNKFDGNATNDIVLSSYVTASKLINNHFSKQQSRTGTDFEIFANTTGTDQNIIKCNTFRGASYTIVTGAASIITENIFGTPAG